jgi:hypothetical protein
MSLYFFGVGCGRVSKVEAKRCDRLAKTHGADFIAIELPEGPRYWFQCTDMGYPVNGQRMAKVMSAVGKVKTKKV